jgi:hypothetical protein
MQSHFDKLNTYLTVWENLASTLTYELKSKKEEEVDDIINENQGNNKKIVEEDETE